MEDNRSWLAVQTELALDLLDSLIECLNLHLLSRRRIQAQGEEGLCCACALADGMDFIEGGMKVPT